MLAVILSKNPLSFTRETQRTHLLPATAGCQLLREGKRHSIWHNPRLKQQSTVPRHTEINDITAKAICRDLGVPFPKR